MPRTQLASESRALRQSEQLVTEALPDITRSTIEKAKSGSHKHQELIYKYQLNYVRERLREKMNRRKSSLVPRIIGAAIFALPVSGEAMSAAGDRLGGRGRPRKVIEVAPQPVVVEDEYCSLEGEQKAKRDDNKGLIGLHNRLLSDIDESYDDSHIAVPAVNDALGLRSMGDVSEPSGIAEGDGSSTLTGVAQAATANTHPNFPAKNPQVIRVKSKLGKQYSRRVSTAREPNARLTCSKCGNEFIGFNHQRNDRMRPICPACKERPDFSKGKEFFCIECQVKFWASQKGPNRRRCKKCRAEYMKANLEKMSMRNRNAES